MIEVSKTTEDKYNWNKLMVSPRPELDDATDCINSIVRMIATYTVTDYSVLLLGHYEWYCISRIDINDINFPDGNNFMGCNVVNVNKENYKRMAEIK